MTKMSIPRSGKRETTRTIKLRVPLQYYITNQHGFLAVMLI